MIINANGTLRYGLSSNYVVVDIGQEFLDYYYSLIPKYIGAQKQANPAHITVVRHKYESAKRNWGIYEGSTIPFMYDNTYQFDGTYFYFNVWSYRIGKIRMALGLPMFIFDRRCYHITIANTKG